MKNAFLRKIEMRCLQIFKNKFKLRWKSATQFTGNLNTPYGNLYENFLSRQRKNYLFNRSYVFFFKSIALFCEKKIEYKHKIKRIIVSLLYIVLPRRKDPDQHHLLSLALGSLDLFFLFSNH